MFDVSNLSGIDRSRPALRTVVVDLAIAVTVCACALIFEAFDFGEVGASLDVVDIAACVGAAALIVLRRRAPLLVLAVAVIAAVWSLIPDDDQGVLRVAAILAVYTMASTSDRRTAWTAGAATAAALYLTAAITASGPWYDGENLELIAWAGLATAAGDAVRSRRAYNLARQEAATALRERAERAEHALEEEARRQVIEERMRIARELHDVAGAGRGDCRPGFDQQPIEVAALADACVQAHAVTGDDGWLNDVDRAIRWFDGDNDLGVAMFDPVTGGSYDGLTPTGPNLNQGAESTLALITTTQHRHRLSGLGA